MTKSETILLVGGAALAVYFVTKDPTPGPAAYGAGGPSSSGVNPNAVGQSKPAPLDWTGLAQSAVQGIFGFASNLLHPTNSATSTAVSQTTDNVSRVGDYGYAGYDVSQFS
jgi:hypothetical protein